MFCRKDKYVIQFEQPDKVEQLAAGNKHDSTQDITLSL